MFSKYSRCSARDCHNDEKSKAVTKMTNNSKFVLSANIVRHYGTHSIKTDNLLVCDNDDFFIRHYGSGSNGYSLIIRTPISADSTPTSGGDEQLKIKTSNDICLRYRRAEVS